MGFSSIRAAFAQRYATPSEFVALMLAWALPVMPITIVMLVQQ